MSSTVQSQMAWLPAYGEPLTQPSVDAAWEFLQAVVPSAILSSGSGRHRREPRRGPLPSSRSDQAFLVFYRKEGLEGSLQQTPLKSPASIKRYLKTQVMGSLAEHWVATQSTQFRARRDGKVIDLGFTSATARHILGLVIDLDGSRMTSQYRELLASNMYAFVTILEEYLDLIGIDTYFLVRSGPVGLHLYVPLIRPDGRPLRASERNLEKWEKVAKALHRYLGEFGADPNAVRITQPFAIPGLPRKKHQGFIPYVMRQREGLRTDIFSLLRRLAERKLVLRREQLPSVQLSSSHGMINDEAPAIAEAVRARAIGMAKGSRNSTAHDLAVWLLCKGVSATEAWEALTAWNTRNMPRLPERELRVCFESAIRCRERHPRTWAEMAAAPWRRLRAEVGLPDDGEATGYLKGGRWRPRTPAKSWEQRKATGGREHFHEVEERVLRFVRSEGGTVAHTQAEIADILGTNRSTLKLVLKRLVQAGSLVLQARRGRGGSTVLTIPVEAVEITKDYDSRRVLNGQTRISTVGVKKGVWVGPAHSGEECVQVWRVVGGRLKDLVITPTVTGCFGKGAGRISPVRRIHLGCRIRMQPALGFGVQNVRLGEARSIPDRPERLLTGVQRLLERLEEVERSLADIETLFNALVSTWESRPLGGALGRGSDLLGRRERLVRIVDRLKEDLARRVDMACKAGVMPAWVESGLFLMRSVEGAGWRVRLCGIQPVQGRSVLVELRHEESSGQVLRVRPRLGSSKLQLERLIRRRLPVRWLEDLAVLVYLVQQVMPGGATESPEALQCLRAKKD